MAKWIIIKKNGAIVSLDVTDAAENAKLDAFNYGAGGLKFTDDSGEIHNMNPDSIDDLKKMP